MYTYTCTCIYIYIYTYVYLYICISIYISCWAYNAKNIVVHNAKILIPKHGTLQSLQPNGRGTVAALWLLLFHP